MALREWDVLDFGTGEEEGREEVQEGLEGRHGQREAREEGRGGPLGQQRASEREGGHGGRARIKIHTPPRVSSAVTAAHFNSASMIPPHPPPSSAP